MSQVSFSANGKEVKNAYDSIISGESSFEWALYGYEDGSNEIELVDSGSMNYYNEYLLIVHFS